MNYKLSPSDLTYLYQDCKFCFWLKVKQGIAQPSMPMPGIFSAIAGRQKEFYAEKRTETFCKELPPGTVAYGEQWVQSRLMSVEGMELQCYIKGRFDVVIKFDDGSYGIIDFKTASPSAKKVEMYSRQLQAYIYALENPDAGQLSLTPITKLGLLFFEPSGYSQMDLTTQSFEGRLIWAEVLRDDKRFSEFMLAVIKLLSGQDPPGASPDCLWCNYRNKTKEIHFVSGTSQSASGRESNEPSCPQCGGSMRIRNGRFGQFWSCVRYPACKGTKNTEFIGQ